MEKNNYRGNRLKKEVIEGSNSAQIAVGTLLLLIGIVLGAILTANGTYALDTSTAGDATTSNATTSNATNSNARYIIATAPNATDSNAQIDYSRIQLFGLELGQVEAKVGDKITINLCANYSLTSAKMLFKSSKGNQFTVFINRLNVDEYIIIPSTVKADTYYISQVVLEAPDMKETFVNGNNFNFTQELKITENKTKTYIYNNEEITEEIIKDIKESSDKSEITINATTNNIISKEIFESIKGTNKQLVIKYNDNEIIFNGKNINNTKDIDVTMEVSCISEDDLSNQISNAGYVIKFADNGELPGVAKIRINATDEIKTFLKGKTAYVYFYDEENKKYTLVGKNVKLNNGYYEFAINHNSKYILTDSQIESKEVEVDENIVNFQDGDKTNYLIISLGIALIIAVMSLLLILSKNNKKD